MPSDFLTPFLELDEEFCKNFRGLEATDVSSMGATTLQQQQQEQQLQQLQHQLQNQLAQNQQQSQHSLRVLGFQRRHSLCPVTLPNSKFNHNNSTSISGSSTPSSASDMMPDSASSFWGGGLGNMAPATSTSTAQQQMQWNREAQNQLPRSALSHIPFRVDRSVSMIEGSSSNVNNSLRENDKILLPPPGLCLSNTSIASSKLTPQSLSPLQLLATTEPLTPPPHISTRYKTELCRTFEESGTCKYGAKCQFAHGMDEMRGLSRHPKYKTEPCRTFHTIGFCPYGARCHFIHNADEILQAGNPPPPPKHNNNNKLRPFLRHSVSFAGFSSAPQTFHPLDLDMGGNNSTSLLFARANSVSPPPSATESPELFSPLLYPADTTASLKNRNYPFISGISDFPVDTSGGDSNSNSGLRFYAVSEATYPSKTPNSILPFQMPTPTVNAPPPGLQRCSSADSLSEEGYTSSCSISSASSGSESPSFEGRRLPIFSRLSVSDE